MKKLLISLGSITAVVAPITAVVACGNASNNIGTNKTISPEEIKKQQEEEKKKAIEFLENASTYLKDHSKDKIKVLPSNVPTLTKENILDQMFKDVAKTDSDLNEITFDEIKKSKIDDHWGHLTVSFKMHYHKQEKLFIKQFNMFNTSENTDAEDLKAIKAVNGSYFYTKTHKNIGSQKWVESTLLTSVDENTYDQKFGIDKIDQYPGFEGMTVTEVIFPGGEDPTLWANSRIVAPGWTGIGDKDPKHETRLGKLESGLLIQLRVQKGRVSFILVVTIRGFAVNK